MSDRGKSTIDYGWNAWKQASRLIDEEAERWRDAPFAEELRIVSTTLLQLGYLLPAERRGILAAIDKLEQGA